MDENKKEYENENEPFDNAIEMKDDIGVDIEEGGAENAGMSISVGASSPEYAPAGKKFSIWKEIRDWVFAIVLALLVVGLIKGFLFDFVVVDGRSMQPTLMNGNRLVLVKMGYTPQYGDIIVFDSNYKVRRAYIDSKKEQGGFGWFDEFKLRWISQEQEKYAIEPCPYVKRVIALENDVIDIVEETGDVYVNGEKIDQSYLDEYTHTYRGRDFEFPYTVPEGCAFVMGDNRGDSRDSRYESLGAVPYEAVIGKAAFRFWPFGSFGSIY